MSSLHPSAAPVMEVFSSIQGEGAYVGELQVFLRLRGCPLRCAWCDTPASWRLKSGERARVVTEQATRDVEPWATPFQAACWIAEAEPAEPRTVSITGGEPLVWPDFLLGIAGMLGERPLHLETAGGHPETLARVQHVFRHVSLDLKVPADLHPPVELEPRPGLATEPVPRDEAEWTQARRRSLALLADRDACAKVIVSGEREVRDFDLLLEDVARRAPALPVIVQPATPVAGQRAPSIALVTEVAERARELELQVRVVPQVHRALDVL